MSALADTIDELILAMNNLTDKSSDMFGGGGDDGSDVVPNEPVAEQDSFASEESEPLTPDFSTPEATESATAETVDFPEPSAMAESSDTGSDFASPAPVAEDSADSFAAPETGGDEPFTEAFAPPPAEESESGSFPAALQNETAGSDSSFPESTVANASSGGDYGGDSEHETAGTQSPMDAGIDKIAEAIKSAIQEAAGAAISQLVGVLGQKEGGSPRFQESRPSSSPAVDLSTYGRPMKRT